MRIGIFGGTFNPIHKGHILLTEYCKTSANLDKIMLIPTYTPPHKVCSSLANEKHRLNMCSIACSQLGDYTVSDIEIQRKGKSYTCDTLTSLKELYPQDELFLIMGADMFLTLDKWRNPEIIFEKAKIITVPRDESDYNVLCDFYRKTLKPMNAEALILKNPVLSVSSTYIRENIDNFEQIESLIDKNVYDYIVKNNLYRK